MSKKLGGDVSREGFILYKDTLKRCLKNLPDFEDKGKLLETISQYVNGEEITYYSERISINFSFLQDGIDRSEAKYKKKQEDAKQFYEKQREEMAQLKKLKILSEQKEFSEQIEDSAQKNTLISTSISTSTSTSISSNTNVLSNNLSKKYSKKQVREILEREGIFFKQISFDAFYELNSREYGWKYDPITAARSYIEKHAGCLSAVKNSPGAPPLGGPNKKPVLVEAQAADEFLKTAILKLSEFLSEADKKIFAQIQPIRLISGVETGKVVERNIAGRKTAVKEVKNKLILRVTDKIIATTIDENKIVSEYLTAQNTFIEWVF